MVVAVGLTVTAVPLVAAMLPGVMTPVPLAKTPVMVVLVPLVMEAEAAVKLEMVAGGVDWEDEPPQPLRAANPTERAMAHAALARRRFMGIPGYRDFDGFSATQ